MQLHTLKSTNPRPTSKRLGRGNGSGKGNTSGRGNKGQKARTGANSNIPRTFIGGSTPLVQRLPKLKGFKSIATKPVSVSMRRLSVAFTEGEKVTLLALIEKGIVSPKEALQGVKIVGGHAATPLTLSFEENNPKLTVSQQLASK
ncbi:50S ribosomal protein L15 [soil metagenome]